jgi:hypothetical protein
MRSPSIAAPRNAGVALLLALTLALGTAFALTSVQPAAAAHNGNIAEMGTTGGWLDGRTVTFKYSKDFFCQQPPASAADSGCALGEEPTVAPRPGADIPVLYVMTPLGFRPDESTLQCPEVGNCINHPSTLDVTRVFGDSEATRNFALPAHSHIVDVRKGGWWEIEVIGVTDPAVWDEIAEAKSLDRVRELQAAGDGITGDIPSNLYLWFNVQR